MPVGRTTLLQAALYVAVASLLALAFLDRAGWYFALAERAMVDATLNNVRSALFARLAQDRLQGNLTRERFWDGGNAFELGRMDVKNFAGTVEGPEKLAALPDGTWAYDSRNGELVYVAGYPRGLRIEGGGRVLRFRLRIPSGGGVPVIEPVRAYQWDP